MDIFIQIFLIKKFQHILVETGMHHFQNFIKDLNNKVVDIKQNTQDIIFSKSIQQCMVSYHAKLLSQDTVAQIIEFIKNNNEYRKIYQQIVCYSNYSDEHMIQPNLTQLLNNENMLPDILSFLDLKSLFNCSETNTSLLFHSYNPISIQHLTANDINTIINRFESRDNRNFKRLALRLKFVKSIYIYIEFRLTEPDEKDIYNKFVKAISDFKRLNKITIDKCPADSFNHLIQNLIISGITEQLKYFQITNAEPNRRIPGLKELLKTAANVQLSGAYSNLIDLSNCEKVSLCDMKMYVLIKISKTCKFLHIHGWWKKEQFLHCDFSGVETLSLSNFTLVDNNDSYDNFAVIKLKNIKKFKMIAPNGDMIQFYNENIHKILQYNHGSLFVHLARVSHWASLFKHAFPISNLIKLQWNLISYIDICWKQHKDTESYMIIQKLLTTPEIKNGITTLRFDTSTVDIDADYRVICNKDCYHYNVIDLLYSFEDTKTKITKVMNELEGLQRRIHNVLNNNSTCTNKCIRTIAPHPKWSQIKTSAELKDAAGSNVDVNVGWRIELPYEAIISVNCVMVSDNVQKIFLKYPHESIAKCFDFDIFEKENRRSAARAGWHLLPNDNLYPAHMETVWKSTWIDWRELLYCSSTTVADKCLTFKKLTDRLVNHKIFDMNKILVNLKKLDVLDIYDNSIRFASDIVNVLNMIKEYLKLLTLDLSDNAKINIGFRINMKVCINELVSHQGINSEMMMICGYIERISHFGVPIDIQIQIKYIDYDRDKELLDKCKHYIFSIFFDKKEQNIQLLMPYRYQFTKSNHWQRITKPLVNFTRSGLRYYKLEIKTATLDNSDYNTTM